MYATQTTKRIDSCNFKLKTLLDFTLAINTNVSTTELLSKYENLLRNQLNIGKILMFTHNVTWKPILVSGVDNSEYIDIDIENEFVGKIDADKATAYSNNTKQDFDIIVPVYQEKTPLSFLLIGDNDGQEDGLSPTIKHLKFIQILTNIVVVAIENNRWYKHNLEREAAYKEMEFASKVQDMLIPDLSELNKFKKVRFEGFYFPHFVVGGDYYDVFRLNKNEIFFTIADVSGKGISAALLMSSLQANLKAIFASYAYLTDVITILNERITNNLRESKFITMFIAIFNHSTQQLKYINAGHNPPILYNKKTKELKYLNKGCIGIGMMDNIELIEEDNIYINDNSKLLCFTDGLIEASVGESVHLCQDDVEKYFCNNSSAKDSIDEIVKTMQINKSNLRIFDDITMLGVDFNVEND